MTIFFPQDSLKKGLGSVESVDVHQLDDDDVSSILSYEEEDDEYDDGSGDGRGADFISRRPTTSRRL